MRGETNDSPFVKNKNHLRSKNNQNALMDNNVAPSEAPTERRNERSNYVVSELSLGGPAVKVNLNIDSIVE